MNKERFVNPAFLGWLVALSAGVLYISTLAPTVVWQDSAMFQLRVWQTDLTGNLPLALSHPLYIVVCRAFAWVIPGDFAWRINLFSAVCSAGALGLLFATLRRVTGLIFPALLAVVVLAVSHTFWTHAVIAEVYSFYALLLALEMYLLIRYEQWQGAAKPWWLISVFLVCGLNLSNHLFALLHLPAYGVYALVQLRSKQIRARHLALMVLAVLIGAGLYESIVLTQILRTDAVIDTIRSALTDTRNPDGMLGRMPNAVDIARCAGYFLLNFPTPLLLLCPVGMYVVIRHRSTRSVGGVWVAIFVMDFIFGLRYHVADQYVFFSPCYFLVAVFIGLAVNQAWGNRSGLSVFPARAGIMLLGILPVLVYEVGPVMVQRTPRVRHIADEALRAERAIPGRDIYTYFLRPRKNGDYSAHDFSMAALELAAPDGLIVADFAVRKPIIYLQQAQGKYPEVYLNWGADKQTPRRVKADVPTVDEWLSSGRRVFIISPARQPRLAEKLREEGRFRLRAKPPLYEVEYADGRSN